jgi:hypothetical protein
LTREGKVELSFLSKTLDVSITFLERWLFTVEENINTYHAQGNYSKFILLNNIQMEYFQ